MISTFLLQLGAGCLLGALPVPATATGRAFNRFVSALAAAILILGLGVAILMQARMGGPGGTAAEPQHAGTIILWSLAAAAALAASAASHTGRLAVGRAILGGSAALCLASIAIDAFALARTGGGSEPLVVLRYLLDALSSSWLLGSVLIAMVLGHYYLNIAGLAIAHLVRVCLVAMAAVFLRGVVAGWGLAEDGADLLKPWLSGDLAGADDILSMVVLLQRLLFGIAGAGLLTTMAWRTARINSTQSATGILYVGFVAVLVGELASRYLLFGTGHPL